MSHNPTSRDKLDARLRPVIELLDKQQLVQQLLARQPGRRQDLVESLLARQQLAELANRLRRLHAADIAELLERLPPEQRQLVWSQVVDAQAAEVLSEAPEAVIDTLVETTPHERLLAVLRQVERDDLRHIAERLPPELLQRLYPTLDAESRAWVRGREDYPEDSVGRLMSPEMVVVRETDTVKQVIKALRGLERFPEQTDQLFVVDDSDRLTGLLPLTTLLLHEPRMTAAEIMDREVEPFAPDEDAAAAALAFERYDLVSAPVTDADGCLVGRLTVDAVMDFVREEAEEDVLNREGLSGDVDLFAPVWPSARGRWLWLGLNLITAFIASRFIGLFEDAIEKLVALATLMPIVASIGGNTGNQTIALFIRGLALGHIDSGNLRYLVLKELGVSLVNGLLWGSLMGLVAYALYGNPVLGAVMAVATLLNLAIASLAGSGIPLLMHKLNRDPALGSTVLLTFTTDSMGFFIFLGLAALLLTG